MLIDIGWDVTHLKISSQTWGSFFLGITAAVAAMIQIRIDWLMRSFNVGVSAAKGHLRIADGEFLGILPIYTFFPVYKGLFYVHATW